MENFEILLADDDSDDRSFFQEALVQAAIPAKLTMVEDGKQLTDFLAGITNPPPPDIIFLDINMPLKNGKICLREIRNDKKFNSVPVVMFSTSSYHKDIEDTYATGANMYIVKSDFFENEVCTLKSLFSVNWKEHFMNRPKEKFVLKMN